MACRSRFSTIGGVGSYEKRLSGGITGRGLNKNIVDDYRYLVQNYAVGDEIFLFGFSRGAYTIRCLCGLINNVGILKRPDARLINAAFEHYKKAGAAYAPAGEKSKAFRAAHSQASRKVHFVGVWDTVGAMGIPFSFLGLFDDKDEFYDTKIGRNVEVARHAMAIDEVREDFEPTVWEPRHTVDIRQVWFAGVHSNIGGSYAPDQDGAALSDTPLEWIMGEAKSHGLALEPHLKAQLKTNPLAKLHNSRRSFYRVKKKFFRDIDHGKGDVLIHESVKQRWDQDPKYRPKNLVAYLETQDWPETLVKSSV